MTYAAKSQEKMVEFVKVGEEGNKNSKQVAAAQRSVAKSRKVHSWMEVFSIERTDIELKRHFARKPQRIALVEMDQELKVGSVGNNKELDMQNIPYDCVPNATANNEEGVVQRP